MNTSIDSFARPLVATNCFGSIVALATVELHLQFGHGHLLPLQLHVTSQLGNSGLRLVSSFSTLSFSFRHLKFLAFSVNGVCSPVGTDTV